MPNGEKYNWRRRAKRMAMKVARDEEIKTSDNKAQFINKNKSNKVINDYRLIVMI